MSPLRGSGLGLNAFYTDATPMGFTITGGMGIPFLSPVGFICLGVFHYLCRDKAVPGPKPRRGDIWLLLCFRRVLCQKLYTPSYFLLLGIPTAKCRDTSRQNVQLRQKILSRVKRAAAQETPRFQGLPHEYCVSL